MQAAKRIVILSETPMRSFSGGAATAPSPDLEVLRFRIEAGEKELEALRHARRSMLSEEWTLGRRDDEPSLEDATFSIDAIVWPVWPEQRARCLEKIAELEARVERVFGAPPEA